MRKFLTLTALVVSGWGGAGLAHADTDAALEKAMANIPIEKILSQILSSIDTQALSQGLEKAAQDIAAGKAPEQGATSPAMQEMQAKLQKQIQTMAPELARGMASVIGPLVSGALTELKAELANAR